MPRPFIVTVLAVACLMLTATASVSAGGSGPLGSASPGASASSPAAPPPALTTADGLPARAWMGSPFVPATTPRLRIVCFRHTITGEWTCLVLRDDGSCYVSTWDAARECAAA